MKTAVVYWSGTGNTEAMAKEVEQGMKAAGAEVEVFEAAAFSGDKMGEYDASLSAARLWEMKNWKIRNLHLCLMTARAVCPEKRSDYSVLTAGVTENGCATGKLPVKKKEPIWYRMA